MFDIDNPESKVQDPAQSLYQSLKSISVQMESPSSLHLVPSGVVITYLEPYIYFINVK